MRHRNHSNRLSQKPHHAWMMLRNMLTSLLLYERIRTTKKRAHALRPMLEKVLTVGKNARDDLAIRRINEWVTDENACRKIMEVFRSRYKDRSSGFVRITPVGMRKGDGAYLVDMTLIDGVDGGEVIEEKKQTTQKSLKNDGKMTSGASKSAKKPSKPKISSASPASSDSSASS